MDAPFEHNDDTTMMTVTKNILLAHGRTVQVLRKNCPDAKVGIAPTGDCCLPKDGSPEEVEKAQANGAVLCRAHQKSSHAILLLA